MSTIVDVISWVLLVAGGVFGVIGAFGMLRLPDFYTRMHAASIVDTASMAAILTGLMLQAGPTLIAVKLIFIVAFLLITSPTATHALARAALHDGLDPQLDYDKRERA